MLQIQVGFSESSQVRQSLSVEETAISPEGCRTALKLHFLYRDARAKLSTLRLNKKPIRVRFKLNRHTDDPIAELGMFVDYCNYRRHHESLDNVALADAYTRRVAAISEQRE
jgi:hypothetical protein